MHQSCNIINTAAVIIMGIAVGTEVIGVVVTGIAAVVVATEVATNHPAYKQLINQST
jgi:hypothetical protein